MELRYYIAARGDSPFRDWFDRLDRHAATKVTLAIERLKLGNTSNVKSLGGGLYEMKIAFGAGYRVYYGYEDQRIVILLGGGTKQRQDRDIAAARARWNDYRQRRRKPGDKAWH